MKIYYIFVTKLTEYYSNKIIYMYKQFKFNHLILILFFALFSFSANAQSGFTANLDAAGLLKVNQALPASASYTFDMRHLSFIQTLAQAQAFLQKYTNAKFIDFQFDISKKTGSMVIHCSRIMDGSPNVNSINHSLEMVHKYGK